MRYQTTWFRKGKVFIPSIGRTPSGLYFEVEPVKIIDAVSSIVIAELVRALETPPHAMPDSPRYGGDWPKVSVVQVAAGLKSWSSFAGSALGVAVIESPQCWQVSAGQGTSSADIENIELPKGAPLQQVGETVMILAERWPMWKSS